MTQQEYDRKIDTIKVCGANRGRHDYQPVSWVKDGQEEHVSMLMCMVCFQRVSIKTLYEQWSEARV